jgi:sugar lactone lactonase YvrE
VYVADTDNHRIEKFTAEGRFLKAWGQLGVRPGEFSYPDGISVAPNGDVYVADNPLVCPCVTRGSVGDRIEVFSPSGKFLFQWTDSVLQHTILSNVSGLAVDSQGDVYATDASHRVVAFGPNHLPLAGWGGEGVASGLLRSPGGVAVDRTGDILVSDTRSGRLQRFTSHGKLVETSSSIGRSGHAGSGLAADSAGHVFLADTNSQRVEELDASGKPVRAWDVTFWDGGLPPHGAIAVDAAGHIYIGNEASMAVDTYTSTGRYTGSIGGTGPDVGSLRSIAALAVDARGRVYVVDSAQKAILVLSPSGTVLARWTAAHFPALGRPRAIALDRLGNIYVGGGRQIVEIAALR